ncbi:outer membrane protein [Pontibacter pamirensis]|uniref:outer membrane protein n=1 Tax=Pontibacter pamirensis TaxID=2562824 RepID=UPI0013897460|nr:outer membrane beta-barrel protein [Pontibacter pamirensis]
MVVTTQGDTLRGFIDYREWDITPKTVSFKTSEDSGKAQEFNAASASYFEVTGMEIYRGFEIPISMDRVDIDNLSRGVPDSKFTTAYIFLKRLQDGAKVSLYSYKDDIKERFFLLEKGEEKPRELLYRRYYDTRNNTRIITQHAYVGQLMNAARHNGLLTDKLQREIEAAAYKEKDLLRVVSKINGRNGEEREMYNQGGIGFRLFAGLALSRGTLEVEGKNPFTDAEENPASYMPRLAFGADAFLNRNVQQLVFRLEAGLTQGSYYMKTNETSGGGSYYDLTYDLKQRTASLMPQLVYNFYNKDNLKLYVGAGFAFNYSTYSGNVYHRKYINPTLDFETLYETADYQELSPSWSTYTLRAGVVVNRKYEISALYLAPNSITKYTNHAVTNGSLSLGINYLFRDK